MKASSSNCSKFEDLHESHSASCAQKDNELGTKKIQSYSQPCSTSSLVVRDEDGEFLIENDPELISLFFDADKNSELKNSQDALSTVVENEQCDLKESQPTNSDADVECSLKNLQLEFLYTGKNCVSLMISDGPSQMLTASNLPGCVSEFLNNLNIPIFYQEREMLQVDTKKPSLAGRWELSLREYPLVLKKLRSWDKSKFRIIQEIPTYVTRLLKFCHPLYSQSSLEQVYFNRDESPLSRILESTEREIRSRLNSSLYAHLAVFQRQSVIFAVLHDGRLLIADEPGLGKTVQAIAIASYYRDEWPCMVLCPAGLRQMWADEFTKWFPELSVNGDQRRGIECNNKEDPIGALINIHSYETIKGSKTFERLKKMIEQKFNFNRPLEGNFDTKLGVLICDESHLLKSYGSVRTERIVPIVKWFHRVIFLSGTPATSNPQELYTQLRALKPRMFTRFADFGARYCNPKYSEYCMNFKGASNLLELNAILSECVMIRRRKQHVLAEIESSVPTKIRHCLLVDIEIEKLRKLGLLRTPKTLSDLTKAYCKCGLVKLPAALKHIEEQLQAKNKLLVFAQHMDILDSITRLFESNSVDYIRIDGGTEMRARQRLVEYFQNNEKCRAGILSITCASTGITLHAANVVIFAELYWNPGVLLQAEDRVHRIGQKKEVHIYYLIAKETFDIHVWETIQKKSTILSETFDQSSSHQLSSESIQKVETVYEAHENPYFHHGPLIDHIAKKSLQIEEKHKAVCNVVLVSDSEETTSCSELFTDLQLKNIGLGERVVSDKRKLKLDQFVADI